MQDNSPFHRGEQAIQQRLGVRERMETFGRRVIRDYMPAQHRDFYQQLSYLFVGHVDEEGWPWASMVYGEQGFMQSPDEKSLLLNAEAVQGDPLRDIKAGQRLGLLGIELATRRRNRLSAECVAAGDGRLDLAVIQSFGNCPQYIQARDFELSAPDAAPPAVRELSVLDRQAQNLIAQADTFFVASYFLDDNGDASQGADVSHRGGRPGFVRVDSERSLTIPDYLGNFHFNTLGNLQENPRAGLLFIDFERGDLLFLTGRTEIIWDSPEIADFDGAERLWTFVLEKGRFIEGAVKGRWSRPQASPNTLITGTWEAADSKRRAREQRMQWRDFKVVDVVAESTSITSFYLRPVEGGLADFTAGQFLTVRAQVGGEELVRTYTVSSAPGENHYRLSIKRDGRFSSYMHDEVRKGALLSVRAPGGSFVLDAEAPRPAVFIAAGVGITPMVAMIRQQLTENFRRRQSREMLLVHWARNKAERPFDRELEELMALAQGQLQILKGLSAPESGDDYDAKGRLDADALQPYLQDSDVDVYICGPTGFMQHSYDMLLAFGIADARIYAEAFGPSSLKRQRRVRLNAAAPVEHALITVLDSKGTTLLENIWREADGSLLEFMEGHGVQPDFACRSGQCGSCSAALNAGGVVYTQDATFDTDAGQVLLCSARPAAKNLRIQLP
jgi:ferredoxin-NADP reductase/predicted pyridoxine 5'-phosphate oxidase superfamily flavin-nucleotide-binding protein